MGKNQKKNGKNRPRNISFIFVLQNDSEAEGVEGSEPPQPSQLQLRGQAQAQADPLQSRQCQCLVVSSQVEFLHNTSIINTFGWKPPLWLKLRNMWKMENCTSSFPKVWMSELRNSNNSSSYRPSL